MFTALFTSVLGRKILIGAGITVGLLWLYRVHTNGIYEQGIQDGKVKFVRELTEQKVKEWEAREKTLEGKEVQLATAERDFEASKDSAKAARLSIKSDLSQGLNSLKAELARVNGEVSTIPANKLDTAIRQSIAELREGDHATPYSR